MNTVNLAEKFSQFSEHWSPRLVGGFDDYDIKIAKIQGEFVWHSHADADETFFVIAGRLNVAFRDRVETLEAGEFLVVPKGVEHCPNADEECQILMIERKGTLNTGDAKDSALTVAQPERI